MGSFRVDMESENPARPGERRTLRSVLVDTGSELSWVPAEILESLGVERNNKWHFRQADGTILERWTGGVFVYVVEHTASPSLQNRSVGRGRVRSGWRPGPDRKSTPLNSS